VKKSKKIFRVVLLSLILAKVSFSLIFTRKSIHINLEQIINGDFNLLDPFSLFILGIFCLSIPSLLFNLQILNLQSISAGKSLKTNRNINNILITANFLLGLAFVLVDLYLYKLADYNAFKTDMFFRFLLVFLFLLPLLIGIVMMIDTFNIINLIKKNNKKRLETKLDSFGRKTDEF